MLLERPSSMEYIVNSSVSLLYLFRALSVPNHKLPLESSEIDKIVLSEILFSSSAYLKSFIELLLGSKCINPSFFAPPSQ